MGDGCTAEIPPQQLLQRRIPPNTLEGAVTSLEDRQWLSTTAIDELVRMLPCQNTKIYDAAFMRADDPQSMLKKTSRGDWLNARSVFPTNHHGNHWTLIVIDPHIAEIGFYNSLPNNRIYEREAKDATDCWISLLSQQNEAKLDRQRWAFRVKDCPAQADTNDCGISVIVCATYRILNLSLPSSFDFVLWRRVLRAVLAHNLPNSQQPLDTSATRAQTASPSIIEDTTRLADASLLRLEFDSKDKELTQARWKHLMATEIVNTLDTLLAENQRCLETSIA